MLYRQINAVFLRSTQMFYVFFVLIYVFLCCSMYCLFCVVLCIVRVYMCVLNFCHRVATQLHLNVSYHIKTRMEQMDVLVYGTFAKKRYNVRLMASLRMSACHNTKTA